jgi:hypothetical protein
MKQCKKNQPKWGCKGEAEYSAADLETFLPVSVFDEPVETLEVGFEMLRWPGWPNKQARTQRQCLATELNIASGELGPMTPIDLDGDGVVEGYLHEFMDEAAAAYADGQYKAARRICRKINKL